MTFSLPDRQVRVFSFLSGKLSRKYDESLEAIQEMQQAGTAVHRVEDMEFGRRLAVERELELPGPDGHVPGRWSNAVWDESGAFVLYPSLLGIKSELFYFLYDEELILTLLVVNIVTNRVVKLLGKDEVVRFLNLTLYQGAPSKKNITTMVGPIFLFLSKISAKCLNCCNRQWQLLQIRFLQTKGKEIQHSFVLATKNHDSTSLLDQNQSMHFRNISSILHDLFYFFRLLQRQVW